VRNRETKNGEDIAYPLLKIFDVHLQLFYGEAQLSTSKSSKPSKSSNQAACKLLDNELYGGTCGCARTRQWTVTKQLGLLGLLDLLVDNCVEKVASEHRGGFEKRFRNLSK
jgi:hypothetical protein